VFIVYLGNNEVIGPYGPGTVFSPFSPSLTLIRASAAARATRTGQLIGTAAGRLARSRRSPSRWQGLEMFMDRRVPENSPALRHVYRHLERNLVDICRTARKAAATTILCTVGSNLRDNPPFASQHKQGLSKDETARCEKLYERAVNLEEKGRYEEAAGLYEAAVRIDDSYAEYLYRLANCHMQTGDFDKARHEYSRARDLDSLRFRPDSRINAAIRSAAARASADNTVLVDAERLFERISPHGIPGQDLFHEHVHLNFHGNYLLAEAILEQVEKTVLRKRMMSAGGPKLSEQECVRLLAFTEWDRYYLKRYVFEGFIKSAPFANQAYHDEKEERFRRELKALEASIGPGLLDRSAAVYEEAIEADPGDAVLHLMYARFLDLAAGKQAGAIEKLRQSIALMPDYRGYSQLGVLLYGQGRHREAQTCLERCLEIKPTHVGANYNLGLAAANEGDLYKAISRFRRTVELDPEYSPAAYGRLSAALRKLERTKEAEETLRRGLEAFPYEAALHYELARLLAAEGRTEEALCEARSAAAINPGHKGATALLKSLSGKR
jgi:tetratricopeptide (TPR) repeat protein